jgi:hypothetical protein
VVGEVEEGLTEVEEVVEEMEVEGEVVVLER